MNDPSTEKKILYVDDEPQALKYFQRLFEDQFPIVTAESVDAALEYLKENAADVSVVVTDQRMPKKSGVQLMEQLRFRYPNIVRILLTAYSELELAIQSVNEGGAFRYLKKPLDEDEMIGTLLRAQEFHSVVDERDRLLHEKLSVLHRLVVMDRIRGLATAATALEGRVRNAWQALVAYMEQSPVQQRLKIQMEEISRLNMTAVARREAELMVRTVEMLRADCIDPATNKAVAVSVRESLGDILKQQAAQATEDAIDLVLSEDSSECEIQTDPGLFRHMVELIVRRIADLQEHPAKIEWDVQSGEEQVTITAKASFDSLESSQLASLFAASIPLQKWPIGLDMDLLSLFMIAHHLGGNMRVLATGPEGPGVSVELPLVMPTTPVQPVDAESFNKVYESLAVWGQEILEFDG